jgi:hypothetical protein
MTPHPAAGDPLRGGGAAFSYLHVLNAAVILGIGGIPDTDLTQHAAVRGPDRDATGCRRAWRIGSGERRPR